MARYIDIEPMVRYLTNDSMKSLSESAEDNHIARLLLEEPVANVVEVKKIKIIRDDLKWWLETNSEKGVVHIPNFVVENMIAKMDGGNAE